MEGAEDWAAETVAADWAWAKGEASGSAVDVETAEIQAVATAEASTAEAWVRGEAMGSAAAAAIRGTVADGSVDDSEAWERAAEAVSATRSEAGEEAHSEAEKGSAEAALAARAAGVAWVAGVDSEGVDDQAPEEAWEEEDQEGGVGCSAREAAERGLAAGATWTAMAAAMAEEVVSGGREVGRAEEGTRLGLREDLVRT